MAVDDIKGILEAAALKRLALQVMGILLPAPANYHNGLILCTKVELALSVESLLPKKIRRRLIRQQNKVYPNRKLSAWEYFRFTVLGVDRYDAPEKISNALNPVQVRQSNTVHCMHNIPARSQILCGLVKVVRHYSYIHCLAVRLTQIMIIHSLCFHCTQTPIEQVQVQTRHLVRQMARMQEVFNTLNERLENIESKLDIHAKHSTIKHKEGGKDEGEGGRTTPHDQPKRKESTAATTQREAATATKESEVPRTAL